MGRKNRLKNNLPSDSVQWDVTRVALVKTAAAHGNPSRKYAVKEVSDASLRGYSEYEFRRLIKTCSTYYNAWLASDDALSMPLGTARYLVSTAETRNVAISIGLWEKARIVIEHHREHCDNHCRALIHSGCVIPDGLSNVMLSQLDSSMSNFAQVAACDPQLLLAASAELEPEVDIGTSSFHAACSSISLASSSTGATFNICRSPEKLGPSIYLLPKPTTIEDQKCIIDDVLLDQYVLANPELFGIDKIKWLATTGGCADNFKGSLTFQRILQHWCVQEHISHQSITRLLKLLHIYQPTYICYKTLPHTGRTLLDVTNSAQVKKARQKKSQKIDLLEEHDCQITSVYGPGLNTSVSVEIGKYVHFGLESAITGTSIGLVHKYHYRNLLRRIHTIRPDLLPESLLEITKPEPDEPFDKETWVNWLYHSRNPDDTDQEPLVFEVRINADGAQWFESSYIKGTPILGKLVAIRTISGQTRIKIPYNLGKPFVIGIYQQILAKPSGQDLLKETIKEMKELHPNTLRKGGPRERASFAVEVVCFNCDAPMRSDLKGTKLCSGFYGCERCRTKGVYVKRAPKGKTKVVITQEPAAPAGTNSSSASTSGNSQEPAGPAGTNSGSASTSGNSQEPAAPAGTNSSSSASTSGNGQAAATKWVKKVVTLNPTGGNKAAAVSGKNKRKRVGGYLKISGRVVKRLRKDIEDTSSSDESDAAEEMHSKNKQNSSQADGQDSSSGNFTAELTIDDDEAEMGDDDEPLEPFADTSGNQHERQHSRSTRSKSAALLQNRHKLAVKSKRKKRAMEEDEGIVSSGGEDENDPDERDVAATTADQCQRSSKNVQSIGGQVGSSKAVKKKGEKGGKKGKKGDQGEKTVGKGGGKMTGGSTYFPEIGAPKRTDQLWPGYMKAEERNNVKKTVHRKKRSCFEDPDTGEEIYKFPMISGFFLDPMHLIDGGVLKDFLEKLVDRIGSHSPGNVSKAPVLNKVNLKIKLINKTRILELCAFRKLQHTPLWKMREFHVIFMYYAYPLFSKFAKQLKDDKNELPGSCTGKKILKAMKYLLKGLHLTKGFSSEPLKEESLQSAQESFIQFLQLYHSIFGVTAMTSKVHALQHVLDDCRTSDSHLDYNTVYDCESEQQQWTRGKIIRTGHNILPQICNRYMERKLYLLPMKVDDEEDRAEDEMGLTKAEVTYMVANETLELPRNFFRRLIVRSSLFETLEFVGFNVRDKFPNNIVRLTDGRIKYITHFEADDENVEEAPTGEMSDMYLVHGFCFSEVQPMFRAPYDSTEIGFFRVGPICLDPHTNTAKGIHSKCMIIPEAVKPGTKDFPDEKFENPVPSGVLDLMVPKKIIGPLTKLTPAERAIRMHQEYEKYFLGCDIPKWAVISLLAPENITQ